MRVCVVAQSIAEANEASKNDAQLPLEDRRTLRASFKQSLLLLLLPKSAPQALWEACGPSGTDEQVRAILEAGGVDVNGTGPWADVSDEKVWIFNGSTALHHASYHGRAGAVATLLQAGAEVDAPDEGGATPLHAAICRCHIAVVQQLLAAGADVNAKDTLAGTSSLHLAACPGGSPELIGVLLAAGADLDARDNQGVAPLHEVAWSGQVERLRVLLEAGASVGAVDAEGNAAIHIAVQRYATAGRDICRELIRAGADPMAPRQDGHSALAIACLVMRRPEIVRILLSAPGAEPNAVISTDGWTAMNIAAHMGDVSTVLALLQCGARADVKGMRGCTPVHFAAQSGDASTVRAVLFEGSGDVNAVNDEGSTPVVYALDATLDATTHEPAFVLTLETLLENGAVPDEEILLNILARFFTRRKEVALIASYSAAPLLENMPHWLVLSARDAAMQRLSELTEAHGAEFRRALEGALAYVVEGHARAAAHAAAAAAEKGDSGGDILARELLLLPHRRLAALRDKWLAAMLRELAFSSLEAAADVERAAAALGGNAIAAGGDTATASTAVAGPGGLDTSGATPAAEEAPPPPRRIPHTAVWRLAMARLLRRCAEEAEADAADRSTKALAAAVGAPPPRAGGAAAASEGAKLCYAAVMCVAKWAEVAQAAREARGLEAGAAEALQAARAQCSEFLSRMDALARQIALRGLTHSAARG